MISVVAGVPPRAIVQLQATPGASWASVHGDQEQGIRRALRIEQGAICAYCMARLRPRRYPDGIEDDFGPVDSKSPWEGGIKIEHWRTRAKSQGLEFSWLNLLGVCPGVTGLEKHCDTFRGALRMEDQGLSLNPKDTNRDVVDLFGYRLTGEIYGKSPGVELDIKRLNLNTSHLVKNRAAVLAFLRNKLKGKKKREARRLLSELEGGGTFAEYKGVRIWYLRKKLQQWS